MRIFCLNLGVGYTFGRVPIASCDFSPSVYSYDDVDGDMQLAHFSLRPEDFNYKVYCSKSGSIQGVFILAPDILRTDI
jgi:glucosylceramidase